MNFKKLHITSLVITHLFYYIQHKKQFKSEQIGVDVRVISRKCPTLNKSM